ncbi:heavy-metal-associated domain-containing protein [Salinarimonas rosea]|uniref:heavy-metal-associated domain-containing protein n=1 Tax=Salinarimonas rosea TaxID=552063 RepID=UPI000428BB22|nr:heavy-metal-associated domain-containing protein [Salinarimonas rosea]
MHLYSVPDMSCGGCAKAIARIVAAVDPAAEVSADVAAKRVSIVSRASDADLRAALARGGYEATPVAAAKAG